MTTSEGVKTVLKTMQKEGEREEE